MCFSENVGSLSCFQKKGKNFILNGALVQFSSTMYKWRLTMATCLNKRQKKNLEEIQNVTAIEYKRIENRFKTNLKQI